MIPPSDWRSPASITPAGRRVRVRRSVAAGPGRPEAARWTRSDCHVQQTVCSGRQQRNAVFLEDVGSTATD